MTPDTPTSDTNTALRLDGLRKRYGRRGVEALRGVSLSVERGECFGLLGPNGAGKTTLMKILMTAIRPTAGQAWLLGQRIGDRRVLARVGYLPESFEFPSYLTPRRLLDYAGRLTHVGRADRRSRTEQLLARVGMLPWLNKSIKHLSKGMTQRVALAQAMINHPELLFLDEPTDGLDPVGRADVRELLRELNRSGVTVFLNSHLLNEVEQLCTRVAVLSAGQVLRIGDPASLIPAVGVPYRIRVAGPGAAALAALAEFRPRATDEGLLLQLQRAEQINEAIDLLRQAGVSIVEVVPVRASLEAQFLQLLDEAPRPDGGGQVRSAGPPPAIGGAAP